MGVFLTADAAATSLDLVTASAFEDWLALQTSQVQALARAAGFRGEAGKVLLAPGPDGAIQKAAGGLGAGEGLAAAALPNALPAGDYRIAWMAPGLDAALVAAGWADGAYRFARYKSADTPPRLALPDGADIAAIESEAAAIALLRDLVNTPASDLGPDGIGRAARDLAAEYDADLDVVKGEDLMADYPLVYAVGKGAERAPRLIEMNWTGKKDGPKIVLVGKGVAFDTGGLNIKTGSNMGLMKKDMGGAAHVLALARLIMDTKLPVELTVIIPAVENSVGPASFRPGDIYRSRKGLTVEIEDTDAEGRLILADALTRASEHKPDLLLDFATLTGAARVALGPELAPLYTDDDQLAADILAASKAVSDPVWRMPLWSPYAVGLKSNVADMKNLGDGPMGGSITAALFLKAFVDPATAGSWAHFDVWAWRPAKFGRPAGAAANGLRAVWSMLKTRYS